MCQSVCPVIPQVRGVREIAVCRTSFFKGRHVAEASQTFVAHADGRGGCDYCSSFVLLRIIPERPIS